MICKDCNHWDDACTNKESDCYGQNTSDDNGCVWGESGWISVRDEMPRGGELVVTYRPDTNGCKVYAERYLYGEWTGWTPYRGPVEYWLHLPRLPED